MSEVIDVLIPAIEKDLGTLPYVIDAIRNHVAHPVGRIFIVAPKSRRIKRLCRAKNCVFVDETRVLPITKDDIRYRTRRWDRSGWMLQQLIKLSGDRICTTKYFLVMDADTVLIRPHRFLENGRTVFYCRQWSQPEYFRMYRRLMGDRPRRPVSFVAHYMLFSKPVLARLKRRIEGRHRTRWYMAILRCINRSHPFAFSEYETYGNFLYALHPERVLIKKARNRSLSGGMRNLTPERIRRLARTWRSLSFHKRKHYSRVVGKKK